MSTSDAQLADDLCRCLCLVGVAAGRHFSWFLEVLPAVIGLAVLLATRRSFPLTGLAYALLGALLSLLLLSRYHDRQLNRLQQSLDHT
jgi:uncharacterized membrane protein YjdF